MNEKIEALRTALAKIGGEVIDHSGDELHARIGDADIRLKLLFASVVYPRDARQLEWRAMDIRKQGFIPLVLAEIVSEGAREFLRQQATGYSDAGGTLFIPQSGAYVLIDRAPPKREKRIMKSVLSGKTSLAVHVLMASIEPMTGVEIAEATGLSLGAVSGALDKLERMGWISTTARGARKLRSISDRSGLLASWRTSRQSEGPIEKQTFFVPQAGSTEELAARVAAAAETAGFDFRFSGIFGSQLHAPYLSSVRQVTCRVKNEDIPAVVETLGARAVSDGWNLALIPSDLPDSDAFRGTIGGFRVASPLVCWIDTVAEGGRAPELAAHLAQERLLSPPR